MEQSIDLTCLHCGQPSALKYHEIYDEVGMELQLSKLLETHFQLHLPETSSGVLCDECMNRLIELVDIAGFAEVEELSKTEKPELSEDDRDIDDSMVEEYLSCNEHENVDQESELEFNIITEELDQNEYEVDIETVDVNAYLDRALKSNLESLNIQWNTSCRSCSCEFKTYQELFDHIKKYHRTKDQNFNCILQDCKQTLANAKLLARHIIFRHSDLQSLQIYGNCPDCEMKFSNFFHFNKHSCCRSIKRKTGLRNFCQICELDFPSLKRFVFHMQFHLPNQRPKVCLICQKFFNDTALFFDHVQYSHEPKGVLACTRCDRTFKTKTVFDLHKRRHDLKYKYECKKCPKKYDHKSLLRGHMEAFHNSSSKFICDICEKKFATSFALRKHTKLHGFECMYVQVHVCTNCGIIGRDDNELLEHINDEGSVCLNAEIQQEIMTEAYTCEFCSKDFKTVTSLQTHRSSGVHLDNLYECPLCKENFKTLKRMRRHTNSHVTYEAWQLGFPLCRYFLCNIENCTDTFAQWSSLYYHKKRSHNKQTCKLCNKTLPNPDLLDEHKKICKEKVEHNCQFCSKQCFTKMSLAVHIAKSHNNKNVACSMCKGSYKSVKALQEHIDLMHVPVKCPHCHKVIKNKRNHQTHIRVVHQQEHRYFCKTCQKGFFQKSEKEAHEKNVHTEVTLKCTECSFTTNYAKSLDIHIAMHRKEFQFKCSICSKEFGRKHILDIHLKRHQIDRQYICSDRIVNGCQATFVSNYLLNKHIKEKHNTAMVSSESTPKTLRKRPRSAEERNQEENIENIVPIDDESLQLPFHESNQNDIPTDEFVC